MSNPENPTAPTDDVAATHEESSPPCGYVWPASRQTFQQMQSLALLCNITGRPMNQLLKEAFNVYSKHMLESESPEPRVVKGRLDGSELARLMAFNRVMIIELSKRMQITERHIRQVLRTGLQER